MPPISTARLMQLDEITTLYRACGAKMLQQGFDNWGDFYPPVVTIMQDIEQENLFVLINEHTIIGVIVLDEIQPSMFSEVSWQFDSIKTLVIHRLAIHPNYQSKGYAKRLVRFAEKQAQEQQYTVIRLDAYSINKKLLEFYKNLGYQITKEAISLGAKWKHPFNCFEKKII